MGSGGHLLVLSLFQCNIEENLGMRHLVLMFTFVCVYRVFACPQKLCGMGIVFIDVFNTIRPLSNFVTRADQDSNSFHLKLLLQASK